jgi:hypothetical protein
MILSSQYRILLLDVGAGPSRSRVAADVDVKESSLLKAISCKDRSKFASLSPVMVAAAG